MQSFNHFTCCLVLVCQEQSVSVKHVLQPHLQQCLLSASLHHPQYCIKPHNTMVSSHKPRQHCCRAWGNTVELSHVHQKYFVQISPPAGVSDRSDHWNSEKCIFVFMHSSFYLLLNTVQLCDRCNVRHCKQIASIPCFAAYMFNFHATSNREQFFHAGMSSNNLLQHAFRQPLDSRVKDPTRQLMFHSSTLGHKELPSSARLTQSTSYLQPPRTRTQFHGSSRLPCFMAPATI